MKYIVIIVMAGIICIFVYDKYMIDDRVTVERAWLDKLQKVAEQAPEIIIDTIYINDTIETTTEVVHEKIKHVEVGADTIKHIDTLSSPYFDVFLTDFVSDNRIINRRWRYNVFQEKKVITEKVLQKVPYPYPDEQELPRFYGGFQAGNLISFDINYRHGSSFIGVGAGYMGHPFYYIRYQFAIW